MVVLEEVVVEVVLVFVPVLVLVLVEVAGDAPKSYHQIWASEEMPSGARATSALLPGT